MRDRALEVAQQPQVEQMLAQMTELAATEGLRYDFAALRHTKTLLAHQAIHHAKAHGAQEALVEQLSGRRALVVLDNCEHLIDVCAALAAAIVGGCPGVRLLYAGGRTPAQAARRPAS